MAYDYFYGSEAEQIVFYRIPKILITSPKFKVLSDSAKLLYGLMLDRMGLSIKNGLIDEQNRAYIYFKVDEVMEYMNCKSEKATKLIYELDTEHGIGLIERIKHGQGKSARIYVKKFIDSDDDAYSETENSDIRKSKPQTFDNQKSVLSETENQGIRKSKCNNNKINNNNFNNNDFSNINPINPATPEKWIDRYNKTISKIKEQIDYDGLILTNDVEIINNIVNVMTDVMIVDTQYYNIEGNNIPAELVRIRYKQITYGKLDAFLLEFGKVYYKIHNPKAYLITALYNVALTADTALSNRVNNDMYGSG